MVVVAQKVGTLCIDYRPPQTLATFVGDDGIFDSRECNQFIIETKFFPGYVPFLPIYALDARCYSQMSIRCFSIFDVMDFVAHLALDQYELKFVPSETYDLANADDEFFVEEVEFEGELSDHWAMRIRVQGKHECLCVTNRKDARGYLNDLRTVFKKIID